MGRCRRGVVAAEGEAARGLDRDAEAEDRRLPHPAPARARSDEPTQLAGKIFAAGRDLLAREIDGTRYRLLGIGVSALADADEADAADLIDRGAERRAAAERAMDRVRGKFGPEAVVKGLALKEED